MRIMPERDASDKSAAFTKFETIPPLVRIAGYSRDIATHWQLDEETAIRLIEFGHVQYRSREVLTDFQGTTLDKKRYPSYIDPNGKHWGMQISRNGYRRYFRILSSIAFEIYSAYLGGNERSRTAAKEVQTVVNDFFPTF